MITPTAVIAWDTDLTPELPIPPRVYVKLLNEKQNVPFNTTIVAGAMVSLYSAFLDCIPEHQQLQFEREVKDRFDFAFERESEYVDKCAVPAELT